MLNGEGEGFGLLLVVPNNDVPVVEDPNPPGAEFEAGKGTVFCGKLPNAEEQGVL